MNYNKRNTATKEQILKHFRGCAFDPKLETYIDVDPYVDKILKNAERFECWADEDLAGFGAIYSNNIESQEAFITMLSVMTKYTKKGIAKEIMEKMIDHCKDTGFKKIYLEVLENNYGAIKLYQIYGFKEYGRNGKFIKMGLEL